MFRNKERLIVTSATTAGYAYIVFSLFEHITNIPIVYPALLSNILLQVSASFLKRSYFIFYWILFFIFVFQLVSFHEDNICIRNTCDITTVQKYIGLACTGLAVLQPKPTKKKDIVPQNKAQTVTEKLELFPVQIPPVTMPNTASNTASNTAQNTTVKLNFNPNPRNLKWV